MSSQLAPGNFAVPIDGNKGTGRYDLDADVQRVFKVLTNGGVAIIPGRIGYATIATPGAAVKKIFNAKRRAAHKKHAITGSLALHRAIHRLPADKEAMIESITVDNGLPLGVVAPYDPDHPLVRNIDPETLAQTAHNGTLGLLIGGGVFHEKLSELAIKEGVTFLGSSANLSGKGVKGRVEDIEPEVREAADIIIDYGLRPYHSFHQSSSIIDFSTDPPNVIRIGLFYDVISDLMLRQFGLQLPADPGRAALPSGHLREVERQYTN
jgi:tRNA A37 threonylcarbamoyladenosine synthetase subunit TsaC/SUA5/YrdC